MPNHNLLAALAAFLLVTVAHGATIFADPSGEASFQRAFDPRLLGGESLPIAQSEASSLVYFGERFTNRVRFLCSATLLAPNAAIVQAECANRQTLPPVIVAGVSGLLDTPVAAVQVRDVIAVLPPVGLEVLSGTPADFVVVITDTAFDCGSGFVRPAALLPEELDSQLAPGKEFLATGLDFSSDANFVAASITVGDGCLVGLPAAALQLFFCSFGAVGPCGDSLSPVFVDVDGEPMVAGFFVGRLSEQNCADPNVGPSLFIRLASIRRSLEALLPAERTCASCPTAPVGFYTVCEETCRDPPTFVRRLVPTDDLDFLLDNPTAVLPAQFPAVDCLCDVVHLDNDETPSFFLAPEESCTPLGCAVGA